MRNRNRANKFHQGKFTPKNPEKYIGDINNIVYRSGWELRYMRFLDGSDDIINWSSEPFPIRYVSPIDNNYHRYFPDFFVKMWNGKRYVVEIKPFKETKPPRKTKRKEKYLEERKRKHREIKRWNMYNVNKSKWNAAEVFCEENNMEFVVITEKHMNLDGSIRKRKKP